ncbi:MAG: hypothetical protein KAK00_07395 [Nanoarchaeota archaeon]|nr:hypothetical protein [Nanoarchaeota archaeon]
MKNKWLYWAPRILAISFAVFTTLFAVDVFWKGYGFWGTVLALLIHLIPTYLIIIATLVAWKWETIGGIIFIVLGISYIIMIMDKASMIAYLVIAGPVILAGSLFILNKIIK